MTRHQLVLILVSVAAPVSAAAESAPQTFTNEQVKSVCGSDVSCIATLTNMVSAQEQIKIGKLVVFDPGRVRVRSHAREDIMAIARAWRANAARTTIIIEGHAFEANEEDSIALGQKRADKVRDYLIRYGVDARHVTAIGHSRHAIEEGAGMHVDIIFQSRSSN